MSAGSGGGSSSSLSLFGLVVGIVVFVEHQQLLQQ